MDTKNKTTLVIMAAGMGSRFGGLKQVEPVGENGQAIIDYSLTDAKRAGFDKACAYLNSKGYQAEVYGGGFWVNGAGYSLFLDEYEPLMEEMEKAEYVEMAQLLKP